MNIYLVVRNLKDTDDKLVAISVRGSKGDIYYQSCSICNRNEDKKICNILYVDAIKYINEILIGKREFYLRYINVIGDLFYLPFQEYSWKRSTGTFYALSKYLKKGTELHESCRELYEYIKRLMKSVHINYSNWGRNNSGYMWADHKKIKVELGKLAGKDKYYDEDKALQEFLDWN